MFRPVTRTVGWSAMEYHVGQQPENFMLWVDMVGGFRVCLADQVTIGQPIAGSRVDVPILGDISGRHARIERDGGGYLIEAYRDVRLDGRKVERTSTLTDGSRLELGEGVRLCFRRPHALSATARLDFLSRHRTQPSADAVLLMAESCILGPRKHSHVVCPDWPGEVILYRQDEQLLCRASGIIVIDGKNHKGRGPLSRSSRVEGEWFSFTLEQLAM